MLEIIRHQAKELFIGARHARMHPAFKLETGAEGGGCVLELFVPDEAFDEYIARLAGRELVELVLHFVLLLRDKRRRLDFEQRRGHEQKIARDV